MRCPKCQTRMEVAGESEKPFSEPPITVTVDFKCPRCGMEWCYDRDHQTLVPCNC